jgi:hypothetical protein
MGLGSARLAGLELNEGASILDSLAIEDGEQEETTVFQGIRRRK